MNYKNNTASLSSSFLIVVSCYFILKPPISKIHGGKTTQKISFKFTFFSLFEEPCLRDACYQLKNRGVERPTTRVLHG